MNWLESLIWYNCHDQLVINHDQKWSAMINRNFWHQNFQHYVPNWFWWKSFSRFPASYSTPNLNKTFHFTCHKPLVLQKSSKKNTWVSPVCLVRVWKASFHAKPQGFPDARSGRLAPHAFVSCGGHENRCDSEKKNHADTNGPKGNLKGRDYKWRAGGGWWWWWWWLLLLLLLYWSCAMCFLV